MRTVFMKIAVPNLTINEEELFYKFLSVKVKLKCGTKE